MGQYWLCRTHYRVDVDKMTHSSVCGKLGECFWEGVLHPESLMVPIWPKERLWSMTKKFLELRATTSTAPILRLPIELLNKIVEYLNDAADIAALCVAHPILGVIGEDRFRKVYEEENGRRARHRLITLGDYTEVNDLPESVQDDLQQDVNAYNVNRGVDPDLEEDGRCDLWLCVQTKPYTQYLRRVYNVIRWGNASSISVHDWQRLERIQDLVLLSYPSPYQEDLVLCNLTKNVYVRNGPVQKLSDHMKDIARVEPNLGTVVLAYSCWSSNSSAAMIDEIGEKITRGPWAGDCFEIRTFASMRTDAEWEDVTDEAVAWLKEIYEADYGPLKD